jgi:hypothetical protein
VTDLLEQAQGELYVLDADTFTARRDELAAAARTAGEPLAAKQIGGLRKPTKAALLINRFVRAEPGALSRLGALGDELRRAQRTMDGAQLRELGARRRQLINSLVQQALAGSPSDAIRSAITSTFEAALADPDIAEQVGGGALVRPVEWSGFGDVAPPLTLVRPPEPRGRTRAGSSAERSEATAVQESAAAAAQEAAVAEAEAELSSAQAAVATAEELRQTATEKIDGLEEQLVQARLDLRAAGAHHRAAQARERDAARRLGRIRGS